MFGDLRIMVMMQLKNGPKTGYDLMARIKQVTGSWKPSSGSMYPLLGELKGKGFVTERVQGRKKLIALTKKGKGYIKELTSQKQRLLEKLSESISVIEAVCGKEHVEMVREVISSIHEGKEPFAPLGNEMSELRQTLFRLWKEGKMAAKKSRVRAIVRKTVMELKSL